MIQRTNAKVDRWSRADAGQQFDPKVVEESLPTIRRPAIAALVAVALMIPRRFTETVVNALKETLPPAAVAGTTVLGAALVVATSVATIVGPPAASRPRLAVPAPDADVEAADEVLGIFISRAPDTTPKARRTATGMSAQRQDARTKAAAKQRRGDGRDNRPPAKDKSVSRRPVTAVDDSTAATNDSPQQVVPSVPLDPQKQRGADCTNDGNLRTLGGTLHCGP